VRGRDSFAVQDVERVGHRRLVPELAQAMTKRCAMSLTPRCAIRGCEAEDAERLLGESKP
jgi:hypothetical protein